MNICKQIIAALSISFCLFANTTFYNSGYNLSCNQSFPCPDEIKDRVYFWVAIFSKYHDDQVVLHDAKEPWKVYDVIDTPLSCEQSGRTNNKIQKKREQIKTTLLSIYKKQKNQQPLSPLESVLFDYFKDSDTKEFKKASKRVRCQNGLKSLFSKGIGVYNHYQKDIVNFLDQHNVSKDIQYLPFVESAYNPTAYSKVGAAGMWQIMPSTARKLGLTVNNTIDERFDPLKASKGAALYLKQSNDHLRTYITKLGMTDHHLLGPFVITSYNYGVLGAKNMLKKVGLNYSKILTDYKGKRSKTAVQNFYSSFLAARYVAIHRDKFFDTARLNANFNKPIKITMQKELTAKTLISFLNLDTTQFKSLNPILRKKIWDGRKRIPVKTNINLPHDHAINTSQLEQLWTKNFDDPIVNELKYKVRSGDTACSIAKNHNIACKKLISENNLGRRGLIRRGQILTIPFKEETTAQQKKRIQKTNTVKIKKQAKQTIIKIEKIITKPKNLEFHGPPIPPKIALKKEQGPMDISIKESLEAIGIGEYLFTDVEIKNRKKYYSIKVNDQETLGHYAEWLNLDTSSSIKKLNRLKSKSIKLDETLYLPIQSKKQLNRFENARIDFHQGIEDLLKQHYNVIGLQHHSIQKNDSLASISKNITYQFGYYVDLILRYVGWDYFEGRV